MSDELQKRFATYQVDKDVEAVEVRYVKRDRSGFLVTVDQAPTDLYAGFLVFSDGHKVVACMAGKDQCAYLKEAAVQFAQANGVTFTDYTNE